VAVEVGMMAGFRQTGAVAWKIQTPRITSLIPEGVPTMIAPWTPGTEAPILSLTISLTYREVGVSTQSK
jgi:hypothetical protein